MMERYSVKIGCSFEAISQVLKISSLGNFQVEASNICVIGKFQECIRVLEVDW